MTAEKAIVGALFTRPPEAYGDVWARDFRKRLAALGYLVLRDPEHSPEAIVDVVLSLEAQLLRQYVEARDWDDAKDVVENFDADKAARAAIAKYVESSSK